MDKVKSKKRRRFFVFLILAVIILAIILAIVNSSSDEKTPTVSEARTEEVSLSFDQGSVYSHAVTDSKIFFYSVDNIKIVSSSGTVEQDMQLKASEPIMSTKGRYALIADKGGKNAYLFNGSTLSKTLTLEENILIAKVNSSGYSLFITEGDIHRHSACVFSPGGEELFKWRSGTLHVVSADISDNSKDIALSTVATDNGIVTSNVYMFNISKEKPFTNELVSDEIFGVMQFSGDYMYCVGVEAIYIYNDYGKCISNISYEGRGLLNYSIADGNIALLFSDSTHMTNGSTVRTYSAKGDFLGEFMLEEKASFMDLKDGSIAVDNNRVVSILDLRCHEKFQMSTETTLSDFLFLGNRSTAVGITATGAEIIEVRK